MDEYDEDAVSRTDMEQFRCTETISHTKVSNPNNSDTMNSPNQATPGFDRLPHAINILNVKYSSEAENVENKLLALSNRNYIGIIEISYS